MSDGVAVSVPAAAAAAAVSSSSDVSRWRYVYIAIAVVQAMLASGIIYGWASLYTLLLDDGVYHDLCAPADPLRPPAPDQVTTHVELEDTVCDAQKTEVQWLYTVASSSNLIAQLWWGW